MRVSQVEDLPVHSLLAHPFGLALFFFLFLISHTALASQQLADAVMPEASGPLLRSHAYQKFAESEKQIVATANPLASQAGIDILKDGGNAIDAMVTIQLVLGLVEPQSSGLGGGAFALVHDSELGKLRTFDGRETAPQKAPVDLFMESDTEPMGFFEAVVGGRSVGTPGTLKLLWTLHQEKGLLNWTEVLAPAIALARQGFEVSPRLAGAIAIDQDRLSSDSETYNYFFPNGKALKPGQILKNPDYAKTLELLSKKGGDYFYQPEFAAQIVKKVRQSANPGYLAIEDFKRYEVKERAPVCSAFLSYQVCGMGPPSSGAIAVNQILRLSEFAGLLQSPPESAAAWHIVSEASRLAFADRGLYLADSDYIAIPKGLLDDAYLHKRSQLIKKDAVLSELKPGKPPGSNDLARTTARSPEQESTSHFVVVDKHGTIVSMTTTIENGFGSRLMVGGFLLNNELTDFSFASRKSGELVANRVEPGKRPRSSMAPTIVYEEGKAILALGSPGGSRIINYVANTLIRTLAWKQPLNQALDAPHFVKRFDTLDLEPGQVNDSMLNELKGKGHKIKQRDLNSGLHAVQIGKNKLRGAADKRREGSVLGL